MAVTELRGLHLILISMYLNRFQGSEQDLIDKRETGSS